jgi:hypothetical protein
MFARFLCWLGFHDWDEDGDEDGLWHVCRRCGKLED